MVEQIICECGMLVKAVSKAHLKSNLITHKKSRRHKELMKIKEGGNID